MFLSSFSILVFSRLARSAESLWSENYVPPISSKVRVHDNISLALTPACSSPTRFFLWRRQWSNLAVSCGRSTCLLLRSISLCTRNALAFIPTFSLVASLFVIVALKAQPAWGQSTVGIQPLGSYASDGLDQVDLANLGVHIDIPLYQHAARGKGMGTNVHLVYDSNYSSAGGTNNPITDVGWRIVPSTAAPGAVIVHEDSSEFVPEQCNPGVTRCNAGFTNFVYSFAFSDATGFVHPFGEGNGANSVRCQGSSPQGCANVNLNVNDVSYDGSGYSIIVNPSAPSPQPQSVVVTDPSGNVYTWSSNNGLTTMADTNGNSGTAVQHPAYWVNWAQTLTDDTNVSATLTGGAYNSSSQTQWTSRAPILVQYHDTAGNLQTVTINYSIQDDVGLVDSVVYPDGSAYRFTYVNNGGLELASMQLPTGGIVQYQTSSLAEGGNGSVGIPATLSRITPDGTTTYNQTAVPCSVGPGCIYAGTSTTSVSKPDGSSEQIHFIYDLVYEGNASGDVNYKYETAHTWHSPTGTLLKSTMKCYNGATGDCTTSPVSIPISQISTTTTLDNGLVSRSVEFLNSTGLETERDEYDFGASSPTRTTTTTYATLGNGIVNRPSSVVIYGFQPSKNVVSQMTYGYDESTLTPTSGLPGHVSPTGARGNQTTQHVWLNTTGATLDSHMNYDDAGQLLAVQDPRTNWTQYGYDAGTDSCRISTTPPTTSDGISQATSATCDANTGLPTIITDANGVKTTLSYDSMLRLTGSNTTTAAGSLASSMARTYSGSSLPETILTSVTATPSPNQNSSVTLDGLGRTVTQISPSGARTDLTYNSMGLLQSVSNQYWSTSDFTYGVTTYIYDALGRQTLLRHPGTGTRTTSYTGNVTTFTDEDGNQWQRAFDGLGRLGQVVEPTGASTTYTYDSLNNLLAVSQTGVSGDTARNRSFAYDSLSRLIAARNPETSSATTPPSLSCAGATGTTWTACYGYDANGNLTSKTDNRSIVTTYSYDPLNRLISKSYSSNANGSPSTCYQYDTAANGIGRLGNEWTLSPSKASCPTTTPFITQRSILAYDAMGRVLNEQQHTPANVASGTVYAPSYTYDLAGNLITSTDGTTPSPTTTPSGAALTFTNSYDGAGHLFSVTSNWADPTHPSPLFSLPTSPSVPCAGSSSSPYTPFGALQNATYGSGLTLNRGYDVRQRVNCENDVGGNTAATSGTATVTITGSEQTQ